MAKDFIGFRLSLGLPVEDSKSIIEIVKKRLLNEKLKLVCLHCLWIGEYKVKELDEIPRCKRCGSRVLGIIYPWEEEIVLKALRKKLKKKKLTREEQDLVKKVQKTSSLLLAYGKRAAIVLAGKGIGPTVASRILASSVNMDDIIRKIIDAERFYIKTKSFWG